jgi:hypothetical protein
MTDDVGIDDYRARYLAAQNAWDRLHRWLAFYRGAAIPADLVLARMELLARDMAPPVDSSGDDA